MEQKCFVVMPIKKPGTEEYEHFSAILENIRESIQKEYQVIRADEVNKPGSITKDIIELLAESDLVIADLTDLNPNVFYELGVRHALKGSGTIMLLDEDRTDQIPFDLTSYRVIKYKGNLIGIKNLKKAIHNTVKEIKEISHKDSPVHDWLPFLPLDIPENTKGSKEAPLREEIKKLKTTIEKYEKIYGKQKSSKQKNDPLEILTDEILNAESGLSPWGIIEKCTEAANSRDCVQFLKNIKPIFERSIRLPVSTLKQLAGLATSLEISNVVLAIYDYTLQLYPNDFNVKSSYLSKMAHSEDPRERKIAQDEILPFIGIELANLVLN